MDALAVAISMGGAMKRWRVSQMLRLALAFGGFQGLMPVVGYLAGKSIADNPWVAAFDHWIAFGLLAFLGCKMIVEARFLPESDDEPNEQGDITKSVTLIILALATSIDALAVGASLAFLGVRIVVPSLVIGLTAALFAVFGAQIGQRAGKHQGRRIEVLGGVALMGIGMKILAEHLVWPSALVW